MSVGVDITSYLQVSCHTKGGGKGTGVDIQLDDVRVPQGTHVLDFALHPGLGLGHVDDGLGDVLHGDSLSGDGMRGHCTRSQEKGGRKGISREQEGDRHQLGTYS